jgi:glycosyltransferase involved in cell wall biosynthesis
MSVLVACGGYAPAVAGGEQMAWNTALGLKGLGHRVAVLTDAAGDDRRSSLPTVAADLAHDCAPALRWQPKIVHAFDLGRPAVIRQALELARRWQVPLALTPATTQVLWPDQALGRQACATADAIFSLTRHEAASLPVPAARRGRIHLIPQGPGISVRTAAHPEVIRDRLPCDGPVVLFLGRRNRLKGYSMLLAAAPRVWRRVPTATFVIAGPPWENDVAPVQADSRLCDLGQVDEQTKLDAIAACDVLCLPSRADVFPLVFVEAWTLGRPVISGDFPGASDVVRNGIDGLVTSMTHEALGATLITILTDRDLRASLGAAGQERARQNLTWEAVARCVEAAYSRMVGPRSGTRYDCV